MAEEDTVSLQIYLQDRLQDVSKAIDIYHATLQDEIHAIKKDIDEVRTLHGELTGKYVTIAMFNTALDQRFESMERLAKQLTETVDVRFQAMDKATALATAALDQRLSGMNEFRAQLGDQQRTFVPRLEYEAKHSDLVSRVENVAIFARDAREQHHSFVTHDENEAARKEMVSRFDNAESARSGLIVRIENLEKVYANLQGRVWAIGVGITILSIAIATVLHFIPV